MGKIGELLQSLLKYKGAIGLASLIVLSALWVLHQILRLPIFAPVGAAGTLGLLTLIVRSVFWLAVTAVVVSAVAYLPARLFIPVSKVEYAVAVFRMFDPMQVSPIAALNDKVEPYVGFPYYSRESDHPSHWPARVMRDRQALYERYAVLFGRPDLQEALHAARAKAEDTSSIQILSSAPGGEEPVNTTVATARMFFNIHLNGDEQALVDALGAGARAYGIPSDHLQAGRALRAGLEGTSPHGRSDLRNLRRLASQDPTPDHRWDRAKGDCKSNPGWYLPPSVDLPIGKLDAGVG